ncbi:MAG TPA: hypothetical protein VN688_06290 [Gemmataceae bacterium]|nr:hypothetical protein [Gemmataceae bacterium]
MRFATRLGGLALLFVLAGPTLGADTPPDVRAIIVPKAQVWCGPSTSAGLYPTNELKQGERVQVVEELPSGWLAIRPPAGSFSWINTRFVKHIAAKYTNYVVAYENYPVPVLIGSSVKSERPTKAGVKLPRGAQVRGIPGGHTMTDDEGVWLPIEPPEGEVRYVRKEEAAKPGSPTRTTVAAAGSARFAVPPADGDALWRDAEKAERAGRLADAIRLYQLAGDANLAVNHARADEAYRRAHWLQQANSTTNAPGSGTYFYPDRNAAAAQSPPNGSVYTLPTNQGGANAVHLIGSSSPGAPTGQLVSTQTASPRWGGVQSNAYGPPVLGRLRPAHRGVENQRTYLLINDRGVPLMYVIAQPGVDLTSYLDRNVELCGPIVYWKDLRANLMTAVQVREQP